MSTRKEFLSLIIATTATTLVPDNLKAAPITETNGPSPTWVSPVLNASSHLVNLHAGQVSFLVAGKLQTIPYGGTEFTSLVGPGITSFSQCDTSFLLASARGAYFFQPGDYSQLIVDGDITEPQLTRVPETLYATFVRNGQSYLAIKNSLALPAIFAGTIELPATPDNVSGQPRSMTKDECQIALNSNGLAVGQPLATESGTVWLCLTQPFVPAGSTELQTKAIDNWVTTTLRSPDGKALLTLGRVVDTGSHFTYQASEQYPCPLVVSEQADQVASLAINNNLVVATADGQKIQFQWINLTNEATFPANLDLNLNDLPESYQLSLLDNNGRLSVVITDINSAQVRHIDVAGYFAKEPNSDRTTNVGHTFSYLDAIHTKMNNDAPYAIISARTNNDQSVLAAFRLKSANKTFLFASK